MKKTVILNLIVLMSLGITQGIIGMQRAPGHPVFDRPASELLGASSIGKSGAFGQASMIIAPTPLHSAVEEGNLQKVRSLLATPEGKSDLNKIAGSFKVTPLSHAVYKDNPEIAQLLISAGADVNTSNRIGMSPLYMAIAYNKPELARMLLNNGADILQQFGEREPKSLLEVAMSRNNEPIINLIKNNAKELGAQIIEATTSVDQLLKSQKLNSLFSLDPAIANSLQTMLVKKFQQLQAQINKPGASGQTPLTQSIALGSNPLIMQAMLIAQADPNKPNSQGITPLVEAIDLGKHEMISFLLANGADKNLQSGSKNISPLHEAVDKGNGLAAQILLAAGANANLSDVNGQTPLFYAVKNNNKAIAAQLLEGGANPNHPDQTGKTPLNWATRKGYTDIAAMIKAKTMLGK